MDFGAFCRVVRAVRERYPVRIARSIGLTLNRSYEGLTGARHGLLGLGLGLGLGVKG